MSLRAAWCVACCSHRPLVCRCAGSPPVRERERREKLQKLFANFRVAVETTAIVAVLLVIRAVLWAFGIEGMNLSPLTSSIVAGGVFVMGLVVAGTLSDYKTRNGRPQISPLGLYADPPRVGVDGRAVGQARPDAAPRPPRPDRSRPSAPTSTPASPPTSTSKPRRPRSKSSSSRTKR